MISPVKSDFILFHLRIVKVKPCGWRRARCQFLLENLLNFSLIRDLNFKIFFINKDDRIFLYILRLIL